MTAPFYTGAQRALQEAQGATKLAETVAGAIVWDEVAGPAADFIASRDFFFLSTVDGFGRPTVSYKGGPEGMVRIADPKTLLFPAYDGNGMFLSLGNIVETGKIGMLFIDFETPNRVRVQGDATIDENDQELTRWPGAKMVVRVAVERCFLNCARYIHRHQRVETSRYVPAPDGAQPHPSWKRIDFVQDALPEADRERTRAAGTITMEDYAVHLAEGRS